MKINEVEELLGVSRSNIRFYEKEGLFTPERKENNYREYSEKDISELKKILSLRKLGFSIVEISRLKSGELPLCTAAEENIKRLEGEIEELKSALELSRELASKAHTYDTVDEDVLWEEICGLERHGNKFVEIWNDYKEFQKPFAESAARFFVGMNSEQVNKFSSEKGIKFTVLAVILILAIRLVFRAFVIGTFTDALLQDLIFLVIMVSLSTVFWIIYKISKKAFTVIINVFLIICVLFVAAAVLFLIGAYGWVFIKWVFKL